MTTACDGTSHTYCTSYVHNNISLNEMKSSEILAQGTVSYRKIKNPMH
jgi:hypothetical protein